MGLRRNENVLKEKSGKIIKKIEFPSCRELLENPSLSIKIEFLNLKGAKKWSSNHLICCFRAHLIKSLERNSVELSQKKQDKYHMSQEISNKSDQYFEASNFDLSQKGFSFISFFSSKNLYF
jgi:hypothetical protein